MLGLSDKVGLTSQIRNEADKINDKWGEFVITPALMRGMEDIILDSDF